MAHEDSEFARRARFMTATSGPRRIARDERYPAGEYPNQHAGGDGLPRWTAADRSLEDTDVVLWYVFGSHHVPRLEDWPVMPVVTLRLPAAAGRLLRPQSRARRAAAGGALSPDVGTTRHCGGR